MIFTFIAGMLASLFGSTSSGTLNNIPSPLTVNEQEVLDMYGGPGFYMEKCSRDVVSLDAGEPALKSEDKK
jgi:hypothetical protein